MKSEKEIHAGFEAYLRNEGLCYVHHRMDKRSGIGEGWPDFTICHVGRCCLIEMKMPKGKLSERQCEVTQHLRDNGCPTVIARSVEQAVSAVQAWLGIENAATEPLVRGNEACQHPSWDRCTGPEGDSRVGKLICMDCGVPKEKVLVSADSSNGLWVATMSSGIDYVFKGDPKPGGLACIVRRAAPEDIRNLPRK